MRTKKAIFKKGLYQFFVELEDKTIRSDSERCKVYATMTSEKQAENFLSAFISGLTYRNENLKAKEYGFRIMPDNWEDL